MKERPLSGERSRQRRRRQPLARTPGGGKPGPRPARRQGERMRRGRRRRRHTRRSRKADGGSASGVGLVAGARRAGAAPTPGRASGAAASSRHRRVGSRLRPLSTVRGHGPRRCRPGVGPGAGDQRGSTQCSGHGNEKGVQMQRTTDSPASPSPVRPCWRCLPWSPKACVRAPGVSTAPGDPFDPRTYAPEASSSSCPRERRAEVTCQVNGTRPFTDPEAILYKSTAPRSRSAPTS